jgi:DNA polymerase/3'-5' exonuclease PolX
MDRAVALPLAEKVAAALAPFCEKVEIAGSIRRLKPDVHDIDIVALPKSLDQPGSLGGIAHLDASAVWLLQVPKALKSVHLKVQVFGPELIRCVFVDNGFQVDVYRARPETWGVILLVRTGSRAHNVKLCSFAKSKGLRLSASDGVLSNGEVIASQSEGEIFNELGLPFVAPEKREVR